MRHTIGQERRIPTGSGLHRTHRRKRKAGWIWTAVGIYIVLAACGCIRVPEESWTVSQRSPFEIRRKAAECPAAGLAPYVPEGSGPGGITPARTVQSTALNAGGFSLVNWNIYKGKKAGWADDFRRFSRDTDILILQEAYLTDSLKQMLQREGYHWDMTAAFEYRQIDAGVLTAARTAPSFTCAFRETEPITRISKSTLITRYPISGTGRELLVANMHAINFTMAASAFENQFDRLEAILAAYRGPLIVSGDLNTWTSGRMSRVSMDKYG